MHKPEAKKIRRFSTLGLAGMLAVTALLVSACSMIVIPNDETRDLYHHNWWNYYARGIAHFQRNDIEGARENFEICLGIRSGAKFAYDEEKWRVRTYGLHFLDGYFPNRELGVCHFLLGDLMTAETLLNKSLEREPSGRAKHYLNLVTRTQLQTRTVAPPRIELSEASRPVWTRERRRVVAGTASGEGRIRDILVNKAPQFIELAETQRAFEQAVDLTPGTNIVTVTAHDLKGQQTTQHIRWIADWQPPQIAILAIERDGDEWQIEGECHDDFGVTEVLVNGSPIAQAAAEDRRVRVPIVLRIPAGGRALLTASDIAGNRMAFDLAPRDLVAERNTRHAPRVASAADGLLDTGRALLALAPADEPADDAGPELHLGTAQGPVVSMDAEFFLDGYASDAGGLAAISVNGETCLPAAGAGALRAYFARRLNLAYGTNVVSVTALDRAGNRSARQLLVVRKDPEYLNEAFRIALVVPPMPAEEPEVLKEHVRRTIESEILRAPARFHLLEREEGWAHILREQNLSVSDLAHPRAALRLGRILSSDMILLSTLMRNGKGLTVYARMVDAETGEVVFDTDVYTETEQGEMVDRVEGLVMKIERRFPLLKGNVLSVSGREATIDIGAEAGLSRESRFIVVSRGEQDTRMGYGEVCKQEGRFVELRVTRLNDDVGIVEITPATARDRVEEGYYVYAR